MQLTLFSLYPRHSAGCGNSAAEISADPAAPPLGSELPSPLPGPESELQNSNQCPNPLAVNYLHWVRVYPSHGNEYYRYTCKVGRIFAYDEHIPGGTVFNPIAQARAAEVVKAIALNQSPNEIARLIGTWKRRGNTK